MAEYDVVMGDVKKQKKGDGVGKRSVIERTRLWRKPLRDQG